MDESRSSAVESAKAFIAGGFGGLSAVLVGQLFIEVKDSFVFVSLHIL